MKTVQIVAAESGYCEESENFKSSLLITRDASHGKVTMSMQIPKDHHDADGNDLFLYRCSVGDDTVHEDMFSLDTLICLYHLVEAQLRVYGIETTQLELVESEPEEPSA